MNLVFGYGSIFFFSIDIYIKLNTSIYKLGIINSDKIDILYNYFKKDFLLDFIPYMGTLISLLTE